MHGNEQPKVKMGGTAMTAVGKVDGATGASGGAGGGLGDTGGLFGSLLETSTEALKKKL